MTFQEMPLRHLMRSAVLRPSGTFRRLIRGFSAKFPVKTGAAFIFAILAVGTAHAGDNSAFTFAQSSTVNIAATAASGNVALGATAEFRMFNSGSVTVFVKCGATNAVTASTATDMPVAPGTVEIVSAPACVYIAAITAAGAATIYFTPGVGI